MDIHTPFNTGDGRSTFDYGKLIPPQPSTPNRDGEPMWTSPAPKRSRKWILWVAIIVVVFGLAGGGYVAYSRGFLVLPFLSPKIEDLFAKMVDSMGSIKNAQYSFRLAIKTEAKENGATPLIVNTGSSRSGSDISGGDLGSALLGFGYADSDDLFKAIPTDMSLDSGFTFYFDDVEDPKKANAFAKLDATYQGGDSSVSIDLEARKKEETLYAIVNKFPSFFFVDFSAIKGKWIMVTPEDATWYSDETLEEIDQKQYAEDAKTLLSVALEKELWTAEGNLPAELIGGVKAQHYRIVVHPEKLADVYQAVIEKKKADGKETRDLESVLKEIKDADTTAQLQRVIDNSTFEVWIDRTNTMLRQISWRLRAVPSETNERWKGRQITATFKMTLEKVNEKVAVDTPSPTIDTDEATRLMTGISKEEQLFTNQLFAISMIRDSLRTYYEYKKEYPATLADIPTELTVAYDQCVQKAETEQKNTNQNANTSTYSLSPKYQCSSLATAKRKLKTIDQYTQKPYPYSPNGDNYSLEYQIQYYEGISEYSKEWYAEGKNTADKSYSSVEKGKEDFAYPIPALNMNGNGNTNNNTNTATNASSMRNSNANTNGNGTVNGSANQNTNTTVSSNDADNDDLSDSLELRYGCDPLTPDTDGDGYLDGEEVQNGYNPNGPGRLSDTGY